LLEIDFKIPHIGVVAMRSAPHSDLEVAPNTDAPEAQKYAYDAPEPYTHPDFEAPKYTLAIAARESNVPKTICGLRKRAFWIALLVALIVVAAAVGGGVGGALSSSSSNNNKNTSGADASQNPSSTPTPTSDPPRSNVTTTSIVGPSSTILRDCPSSNDTLYDVTIDNTNMSFRKECDTSFVNMNGIQNYVGKPVKSLNACIDLCAQYNYVNRTQIQAGTNSICNAVSRRNTYDMVNDWNGGMCFGFTSQNSSGTYKYNLLAQPR
jgi:hypothetical protein